jgi:hypothetical protein
MAVGQQRQSIGVVNRLVGKLKELAYSKRFYDVDEGLLKTVAVKVIIGLVDSQRAQTT